MISVRFSPEEAQEVRTAAAAGSESVSNFVRNAALQQARQTNAVATTAVVTGVVGLAGGSATITRGGPPMSSVADDGRFLAGDPGFHPRIASAA
jgi:hypothetical protein